MRKFILPLSSFLFVIWVVLCFNACNYPSESEGNIVWTEDSLDTKQYYNEIAHPDRFVGKYKDGKAVEANIRALIPYFPGLKYRSCDCDSTLVEFSNLSLAEIRIDKNGIVRGAPKGGDAGDPVAFNDLEYLTPSFRVQTDPTSNIVEEINVSYDEFGNASRRPVYHREVTRAIEKLNGSGAGQPKFNIGIMDTGIDMELATYNSKIKGYLRWEPLRVLTKEEAEAWKASPEANKCERKNYVGQSENDISYVNNNPYDDDDERHGTLVTLLLLNELTGGVNAQIYPIKVLNNKGEGYLFDFICALANPNPPDAYNLSLGFYADTVSFPREFLSGYMNRTNAWFFVAAGNKFRDSHSDPDQGNRNLSTRKFKFFPACLTDVPKQVTVTTVRKDNHTVCATQNYSSEYVHLGVVASECKIGFDGKGGEGSSFATPVALGRSIQAWHNAGLSPENLRNGKREDLFDGRYSIGSLNLGTLGNSGEILDKRVFKMR